MKRTTFASLVLMVAFVESAATGLELLAQLKSSVKPDGGDSETIRPKRRRSTS